MEVLGTDLCLKYFKIALLLTDIILYYVISRHSKIIKNLKALPVRKFSVHNSAKNIKFLPEIDFYFENLRRGLLSQSQTQAKPKVNQSKRCSKSKNQSKAFSASILS